MRNQDMRRVYARDWQRKYRAKEQAALLAGLESLPGESWRRIPGYEENYAISNLGRIRRIKPIAGHALGMLLRPRSDKDGYQRVDLWLRRTGKHYGVHKLVALAFLEPRPTPDHQINHMDGNKSNNRPENLEWVTLTENHWHAWRTGLRMPQQGERNGGAKLTASQVLEIRAQHGQQSGNKLAKRYGVSPTTISQIILRHRWTHI